MATDRSAAPPSTQAPQPIACLCLLQREGAIILYSSEEQALLDAMMRSSSIPDELGVLGKRTQPDDNDDEGSKGSNTELEPDTEASAPFHSNVTTAALHYASQK